jgi:hypothetical protein
VGPATRRPRAARPVSPERPPVAPPSAGRRAGIEPSDCRRPRQDLGPTARESPTRSSLRAFPPYSRRQGSGWCATRDSHLLGCLLRSASHGSCVD